MSKVARRSSDDPTEQPEPDAPVYGAVLSPSGTVLGVPRALDSGRPQPEPDERWTLGPGHQRDPNEDPDPTETSKLPAPTITRRS